MFALVPGQRSNITMSVRVFTINFKKGLARSLKTSQRDGSLIILGRVVDLKNVKIACRGHLVLLAHKQFLAVLEPFTLDAVLRKHCFKSCLGILALLNMHVLQGLDESIGFLQMEGNL